MPHNTPFKVSIVKLDNYEPSHVANALHELLSPLGGIEKYLSTNQQTIIKPNFLLAKSPQKAVCTHPQIITTLAKQIRAKSGVTPIVTDSPGVGSATSVAKKLGLSTCEDFIVQNADDGFDASEDTTGFKKIEMSKRMVDLPLINVCKAKTHGQMVMTAAVKNTFGAVVGLTKPQLHYRAGPNNLNFARLVNQIHKIVAPKLNILDGVLAMEGNGPSSGTPRELGILMASENAFALDMILSEIWNVDPLKIPFLAAAKEDNFLPERHNITVIGPSIESLRPKPKWKMSQPYLITQLSPGANWLTPIVDNLLTLKPKIDKKNCTACGECIRVCAAEAMTISPEKEKKDSFVVIDKNKCISCFCCQEVCPTGCIKVHAGLGARLLGLRG